MSRNPDSHDRLAEWLEQPPGTDPPDAIDPEVLEAVYALRPERAPAPRVNVDDILASVQTGPLALAESAIDEDSETIHGEVVPFPVASPPSVDAEVTPAPARRRPGTAVKWIALMGGSGGLGLAMVAAATLLVVASPTMFRAAQGPGAFEQASAPAAQPPTQWGPASGAARTAPVLSPDPADEDAPTNGRRQAQEEVEDELAEDRSAEAQQAAAPAEVSAADNDDDAYAMDPGNAFRPRRDIIPEALEAELDAVAAAEPDPEPDLGWGDDLAGEVPAVAAADGVEGLLDVPASEEADGNQTVDLATARRDARPPRLSSDWRTNLDPERADAVQAELDKADGLSGRARGVVIEGAASTVSGASRQILAVWAAEAYLVGGSFQSAEGVARVGLSEGQSGREAAWLYYVLGQALEAQGRAVEALAAYREATAR